MLGWTRPAAAGLILSLLGGCAWIEFADIERQSQTGTTFDRNLYDGYLALSRQEYAEYDLIDQRRFAERARMAAAGERFDPEPLSLRQLTGTQKGQLGDARFRLMKALDGGGRENTPEDAAAAQVAFDCWMQETEEGVSADADRCHDDFEAAMARMAAAPPPQPMGEMPALPEPSTILFGFNSDALSDEAKATLDQVLAAWAGAKAERLVVSGHADLAGDKAYNEDLSERRAKAAVDYLVGQGFSADAITVRSFGELDPTVATADDTAETRNRRVVLSFER